jgi:[ribosomal protein S5]-alanine N-acetyltransferase
VRRWLLDDTLVSREWVEQEIIESQSRFVDGGCGLWAVREAPAEVPIGFVGFRPFWQPPEIELVYGLRPTRWGRGFATEAARAATAYAFDVLAFDEVRAATDTPNTASIAVLERLGFQEWRRTGEGVAGTVRFRISVERWQEIGTLPDPR